jgi:tRNA-Thr(GGU) m(6)t(6)A37 methyltransferase TsaA
MSMRREFRMRPIGFVERPGADETEPEAFFDPAQKSVLVIDNRWADGLTGIEDYSHLVVLFALDRAPRRRSAGAPRPAEGRDGAKPVGFFATRTPKRPNPIGIACPCLLRREGNRLVVTGIDAWPGSPILDLKGYSLRDEYRSDAEMPDWLLALWAHHDAERGGNG